MGTKIYNSETIKNIVEGASIQTSIDGIPNELADKVIPVMEVNPKLLRRTNFLVNSSRTTSGDYSPISATEDYDIYITSVVMSLTKDSTNNASTGQWVLRVVVNGVRTAICGIATITLANQSNPISVTFKDPIKIDRNTSVDTVWNTYTLGTASRSIQIHGFILPSGSNSY